MTGHWLLVHELADDGIEVEHEDCPTIPGRYSDAEHPYVEYDCAVARHEAELGLPWRHRGTEPDKWRDDEPLDPGRYAIEYWCEQMYPSGPWGAAEWDSGLRMAEEGA